MVTFDDICRAAEAIKPFAHRTPVLQSRTLNERLGAQVFCKAENFQRTGSFKFRGACNAVRRLSSEERHRGVLTYSSGNHAQALALACQLHDVPLTVVMPSDAPIAKRRATEGYGATVVLYDRDETTREALATEMAERDGLSVIPPYDHDWIIAGQGTAVKELHEDVENLDLLMVCVGGGGLLSGSSVSSKSMVPGCTVVGVEPEAGDDVKQSFNSGQVVTVPTPDTIADGARTNSPSERTLAHIRAYADDIVTVQDRTLLEVTRFYAERMKVVVEPTGGLSLAALWDGTVDPKGRRIGVVISGGNADLTALARLWETLDA